VVIGASGYQPKLSPYTSAVRAFGLGYFQYSTPVPEPRHIGVRPKGVTFGPGC